MAVLSFRKALWMLCLLFLATQAAAGRAPSAGADELERQACEFVNRHREARDLPRLRWSDELAAIAREHSARMASGKTPFGHAGFEARAGRVLSSRSSGAVAENVALNDYDSSRAAAAAAVGWVESPGHRANIEGPYAVTGVGVATSPSGVFYFTQLFASDAVGAARQERVP